MERARREAIVRMTEQAQSAGCNMVWNVRLETCTIGGKENRKAAGVEVIAYGTAMLAVDARHYERSAERLVGLRILLKQIDSLLGFYDFHHKGRNVHLPAAFAATT